MLEPGLAMDEVGEPAPTTELSGCIRVIGKDSVHKICSGQVVLSLAVAVKELVENSIDAGATLVEVRLRNQGLDALEVSDNGSGVAENNLEALTAKYHTSKLHEFTDLRGIETFGFRGEALSSLCALSETTIVTRHQSTEVGTKVELDHDGKIVKRLPCARSIGTTVTLTNLFETLPVRRREFVRSIKREFAKMCQMLQAYCLVAKGVRIICTNQSAKGGKMTVVQTHGSQDVLTNISAVFGSKQVANIVTLRSPFSGENVNDVLAELRANLDDGLEITEEDVANLKAARFHLEGYISSCSHGAGRSAKDRQYFYVNNRPCDPKNIAKVVNEVYHRYNTQQFPFVYLNVLAERSGVDVNLAPDKRQLLIYNEKMLLLIIKKSLIDAFGNTPSTYKLQNSTIANMFVVESKAAGDVVPRLDIVDRKNETPETIPLSSTQRFMDVLSQWKHTGDTAGSAPRISQKRKCVEEVEVRTLKLKKIHEYLNREEHAGKPCSSKSEDPDETAPGSKNTSLIDVTDLKTQSAECDLLMENADISSAASISRLACKILTPVLDTNLDELAECTKSDDEIIQPVSNSLSTTSTAVELDGTDSESEVSISNFSCAEIRTSLQEIRLSVAAEEQHKREERARTKLERLRFKCEISPSQNESAEAELQREISKQAFAHMEVVGQFNMGFIVAKLETDLFIVDQHATDEKYNFEMLQRTTTLQNQALALPQTLELTAVNEMVLLSHLDVFEKNGFKFQINEDAPTTQKVRLLGKPFSKNWEFGKDDIDELIFMLQDAPEVSVCRPSRIRAMFASRACRKSVMIGQALNKASMKSLIRHMGEIEQPWNCPHGRPTMRHLVNTAMLLDEEADAIE